VNKKKLLKYFFVIGLMLTILAFTAAKDFTFHTYNLIVSDGNVTADYIFGNLFGENITAGTVDEARIDADIARDIELIGNCSDADCNIGWGNLTGVPSLGGNTTKEIQLAINITGTYFNIDVASMEGTDWGTLTDTKWCVYDQAGTEVDCNVDPVTDTTIGNCSDADCNIGWGNLSGVPSDLADGDDTGYVNDTDINVLTINATSIITRDHIKIEYNSSIQANITIDTSGNIDWW